MQRSERLYQFETGKDKFMMGVEVLLLLLLLKYLIDEMISLYQEGFRQYFSTITGYKAFLGLIPEFHESFSVSWIKYSQNFF